MSGIKDYSTTPANNNATPPNGFPEGMAPASLNDGMRQVMADTRSWYEDPAWINYGDTPTQTGANTFTIATDKTARYTAGTRIKTTGTTPFTLYGTISASSYSAPNTTVTVNMDSGSLDSTLNEVSINQALKTSQYFLDNILTIFDNSDLTKKAQFSVGTIGTGTTKTYTFPDKNGTFAMTDDITAQKIVQVQETLSSAFASGTTTIPLDDTIPQNTEGTEFLTQSITPQFTDSILEIEVVAFHARTTADVYVIGALFQDSTANALAADGFYSNTTAASGQVVIKHSMVAGSTSATTFKYRAGLNSAGTLGFNGSTSARLFGGITKSYIKVTERRT